MKAVAFCSLLLASTLSFAADKPAMTKERIVLDCTTRPVEFVQLLREKYNEQPTMVMTKKDIEGEQIGNVYMTVNSETRAWTLVMNMDNSSYCVVSFGNGFKLYTEK